MASQPTLPSLEDFIAVAERRAIALERSARPMLSPQQLAVHQWVQTGHGNGTVIAVAGSGKTTVLLGKGQALPGAVDYMSGSVAVVAYGRKNAAEFKVRLADRGVDQKRVRSGTAHSFGMSAWRWANPGVIVDDRNQKWGMISDKLRIPEYLQPFVKQLLSLAKQRAIGVLSPIEDCGSWWDIVEHFDLDTQIALDDPNINFEKALGEGVTLAQKALWESIALAPKIIDYDDMPYMPLVGRCRIWQNDWVVVDEAQDTNPCRRELYKRMLKPNGRALFVGDPAQSIYGFTGADNDSLDIIKREFRCLELPLTVTYRCPKAVVRWAQNWVNHIEAHPNNIEGSVKAIEQADFLAKVKELKPVDAIVCRNTKPLVELAFALIRRHIPCHVEGKEIGQGLLALVNRWKVQSLETLKDRLSTYLAKQTAKLKEQGREEAAASVADRVETVVVIIDSLPPGSKVADLRGKISDMFSDDTPNLTLCTAHKSKGLEWGDVYLLGRNRYMPSPFAKKPWQQAQENHLCYVAGTRAMKNLVEVIVPVQEKRNGQV